MYCRRTQGPPSGGFFIIGGVEFLNIYVYSDESGVFDKAHNDIFVFGGILFFSKEEKDICARRYSSVERIVRKIEKAPESTEIKATTVSNKCKYKLYRSLNGVHKFGAVIYQQKVLDRIFASKKDKQRYLDYAYKIAIKRKFQQLIASKIIIADEVRNLYFRVDEHTTATNGKYELGEGLEQEFKWGTFNETWAEYFPPIFPNLKSVNLEFCDSSATILIRASDIVANNIYYKATQGQFPYGGSYNIKNLYVSTLP
jgi:hypothetical protein